MKFHEKSLLLYAVTDSSWLNGRLLKEDVEKSLIGGATFLQLREKDLPEQQLVELAKELQALATQYNVPFVVNDDVEVAIKSGADGVHVGQSDIKNRDIRKMIGEDMILGISANTVETAIAAEKAGADYIGVGAVFATSTKKNAVEIENSVLREIRDAVSIPLVAIGGINKGNILSLKGSGISGVAVVSAIYAQQNIISATKELKELCSQIVEE